MSSFFRYNRYLTVCNQGGLMITEYSTGEYDIFVGIDVDKKSFAFTIKDHGVMEKSKKIPASPEQLYNHIRKTYAGKKVICAYESGPTGFWLYDYLNSRKIPCLVTSPFSIPKPANQMAKTNRTDSRDIAQNLKSGELKPIRVPEDRWRELRHLVSIRSSYSRDGKSAKQRIRALLLQESLHSQLRDPDARWSSRYIRELRGISCVFGVRQRLDLLLDNLEYIQDKTLSTHVTLKDFCDGYPDIKKHMGHLQSIPGIGFVTAVTLLGKMGDPARLRNLKELGAFCGLVPKERSTGERVNKSGITHMGSRELRQLLIESAWRVARMDTCLRQFYERIKNRHHPGFGSKKAVVALARKLTLIIYRVLKDQRDYISYSQPVVIKEKRPKRVYKLQEQPYSSGTTREGYRIKIRP